VAGCGGVAGAAPAGGGRWGPVRAPPPPRGRGAGRPPPLAQLASPDDVQVRHLRDDHGSLSPRARWSRPPHDTLSRPAPANSLALPSLPATLPPAPSLAGRGSEGTPFPSPPSGERGSGRGGTDPPAYRRPREV